VGGGGHAAEILRHTAPDGLLIGIDVDDDALRESEERLRPFGRRKILVKGNFADIGAILESLNIMEVDGILLDLGVSAHQLKTARRGFSFSLNAALDMRMDQSRGLSAYDIINTFPEKELERIIKDFGEDDLHAKKDISYQNNGRTCRCYCQGLTLPIQDKENSSCNPIFPGNQNICQ
jgi:16S rRNA (cytosine1402-N4)-methyltransferase